MTEAELRLAELRALVEVCEACEFRSIPLPVVRELAFRDQQPLASVTDMNERRTK